jgi:hypothetical protein
MKKMRYLIFRNHDYNKKIQIFATQGYHYSSKFDRLSKKKSWRGKEINDVDTVKVIFYHWPIFFSYSRNSICHKLKQISLILGFKSSNHSADK